MKDPKKVARGKNSRVSGADFERRVRADLEDKGWIVDKWSNNIQTGDDKTGWLVQDLWKLIPAKPKFVFNPMLKRRVMMGNNSGFPDFLAFRRIRVIDKADFKRFTLTGEGPKPELEVHKFHYEYEVIGVESKMTGELDKKEREKCEWLLKNNIFSKILIAEKTKIKNKVVIVYKDFKEKYGEEKKD